MTTTAGDNIEELGRHVIIVRPLRPTDNVQPTSPLHDETSPLNVGQFLPFSRLREICCQRLEGRVGQTQGIVLDC